MAPRADEPAEPTESVEHGTAHDGSGNNAISIEQFRPRPRYGLRILGVIIALVLLAVVTFLATRPSESETGQTQPSSTPTASRQLPTPGATINTAVFSNNGDSGSLILESSQWDDDLLTITATVSLDSGSLNFILSVMDDDGEFLDPVLTNKQNMANSGRLVAGQTATVTFVVQRTQTSSASQTMHLLLHDQSQLNVRNLAMLDIPA